MMRMMRLVVSMVVAAVIVGGGGGCDAWTAPTRTVPRTATTSVFMVGGDVDIYMCVCIYIYLDRSFVRWNAKEYLPSTHSLSLSLFLRVREKVHHQQDRVGYTMDSLGGIGRSGASLRPHSQIL